MKKTLAIACLLLAPLAQAGVIDYWHSARLEVEPGLYSVAWSWDQDVGPTVTRSAVELVLEGEWVYSTLFSPRSGSMVLSIVDGALDLSVRVLAEWTDSSGAWLHHSVKIRLDRSPTDVPEPAGLLLIGWACLVAARIGRRSKAA